VRKKVETVNYYLPGHWGFEQREERWQMTEWREGRSFGHVSSIAKKEKKKREGEKGK